MALQTLLKPSKLTWVIFVVIIFIVVLNLITLNTLNFGTDILVNIVFFLPLALFELIGLNITTKTGWFQVPNLLGYILIIGLDIILIYLISLILTKLFKKLKSNKEKLSSL
ncbi:MAG: hypothetical protein CR986_05635 [Ignavibacteriae bacterium]|nr:MAG: hypothetical protein CR986_05635 [Ignavibacteriota bacterium]